MTAEIFEKTFPVSGTARLSLSNIRGSIKVVAGSKDAIQVKAVMHPATGDSKHTEIEMAQDADGAVMVKTRYKRSRLRDFLQVQPCRVDYAVSLPRSCVLKINAMSSDCSVAGLDGDLDINVVSGDLSVSGLAGVLKLGTVSGKVLARELKGDLTLSTVSGDVEIQRSVLSAVAASTVSGEILLESPLSGAGPYRFTSISGNAHLRLPADFSCSAVLQTVSGDLSTNAPTHARSHAHGSQSLDVRGGACKVFMNSVSGNLWLEQAGDAADSASRLRDILVGIENGAITAEDGLAQMR